MTNLSTIRNARAVAFVVLCGIVLASSAFAATGDPGAKTRPPAGGTVFVPSVVANAIDFQPGSGGCGANSEQTIGWQFNVDTEITVTAMSWFDDGLDGLDLSHEVGIWDPSGTLISTTHVVIPGGAAAALDGIWRVVPITPTTLPVGSGYIVGGYNGVHFECLSSNVTQIVNPALTYVDATYALINSTFERPSNFSAATNGFYGVGFQLELGPVAVERESWGRVKADYR